MRLENIPEIDKLSISEKILLVEDLWNTIVADDFHIPVPQSHKDELDRRFKKYQSNSGSLLSLEELQGNLEKRK